MNFRNYLCKYGYLGILMLTLALTALSAGAQNKSASQPVLSASQAQAKMNTRVHLMLGSTTLAQVTAAMCQQTSLEISGSDYLRERKLVVMLDDVRLADALDALAEANDWAWRLDSQGEVVIARRVSRLNQTPASIPGLLRAAMPRDWRVFLGLPPSESNPASATLSIDSSTHQDLFTVYGNSLNWLRATLEPETLLKTPFTYKNMTPAQQERLRLIMVSQALWKTGRNLLYNPLMPHLVDPGMAIIRFKSFKQGDMFVAGSKVKINGQDAEETFGANLGDLKGGGPDVIKP